MMYGRRFPRPARVEGLLETVSGLLVARNSVRRTLEALERAAPDSLRSEAVVRFRKADDRWGLALALADLGEASQSSGGGGEAGSGRAASAVNSRSRPTADIIGGGGGTKGLEGKGVDSTCFPFRPLSAAEVLGRLSGLVLFTTAE